jgi:spore germination protein
VGQTLVIDKQNKIYSMEINGYVFPEINYNYFNEIVDYFTYISIFSYMINNKGDIYDINDEEIINITNRNKVLPIMVVTNIGENGRFNSDLLSEVLNNENAFNNLIKTIINNMKDKKYNILNIDFEYIYPKDKNKYIEFLNNLKKELEKYNYLLFVSVTPKYSGEQQGILYEAHDYHEIGKIANRVVIMTYEWGYTGGPAMAVAPLDKIKRVLNYAISEINSNKILMGIPTYGYDWTLPFAPGTSARSIGNPEAVNIARKYKQSIKYDEIAQTPYFNYYDELTNKHEVWFEDARSIKAKLDLVKEYKLAGVSYWTINRRFPQNYLIIKNNVNVAKYII